MKFISSTSFGGSALLYEFDANDFMLRVNYSSSTTLSPQQILSLHLLKTVLDEG